MRKLRMIAVSAAATAVMSLAMVSGAGALQNPDTGQPGAPTGVACGTGVAAMTPGNASAARGSAFNPSGVAGQNYAGNLNTASSAHSNSTASVSEYDAACVQVTGH
jgi:hypothetical protein